VLWFSCESSTEPAEPEPTGYCTDVYYVPYDGPDGCGCWEAYCYPDKDEIECIATGNSWINSISSCWEFCEEIPDDYLGSCYGRYDCAGNWDGDAVLDDCGVCNGENADKDCNGVCNGDAVIDDCGVCNGENADKDCAGVCFGDDLDIDQDGICDFINPIENFGSDQTLDLITWNLEFFPKNSNETIDYVSHFITNLNLDVIALQEITSEYSFNQLVDQLGPEWMGFRSDDSDNQELSYLINAESVEIISNPYTILEDQEYFFAYKPPYVLEVYFNEIKYILINVHYKCCGNGIIEDDFWDEEYRRQQATYHLKNYIDNNFQNERVVVLGDFNDELTDPPNDNVFLNFLNDSDNYYFTDLYIAEGSSDNWSSPNWPPRHLDHILVTNEILDFDISTNTIKLDDYMVGDWIKYDTYISDRRPVGISLLLNR
tara:strand:- start:1188 stop:2477 length:1290 start_codon:yes stop_codon:yes gene_type:complete